MKAEQMQAGMDTKWWLQLSAAAVLLLIVVVIMMVMLIVKGGCGNCGADTPSNELLR
jgi:hypothetical protein